jgi:hypothetical protein
MIAIWVAPTRNESALLIRRLRAVSTRPPTGFAATVFDWVSGARLVQPNHMREAGSVLIAAIVLLACSAALSSPAAAQGRPDCATVLRALHTKKHEAKLHAPDATVVALRLGVEPEWVERCAQSYGRRVKRSEDPTKTDPDAQMALKEKLETEEYDEVSREEKETLGDRYVTVIENDEQDRKKLRETREEDTHEWEPYETHEWEPVETHEWQPVMHNDEDDWD